MVSRTPAAEDGTPGERADNGTALERGIGLLRCFSETRRILTPTELARLSGLPRATVARLAATLAGLGLLRQEADGEGFLLGPGLVSLAREFLAGLDIRNAARPHLQMLADAAQGSVYLAVRDGLEMVVVETCRPHDTLLAPRLEVGSRVPMANSALGRAWLWAQPLEAREGVVAALRLARGGEWPALEPGLKRALAEADRHGYTLSAGEFHREIHSVAVPLVGPSGEVMALNCGIAASLHPEDHLRQVVAPQLLAMARALAADIGGSVPPPHPRPR